MSAVFDPRNGGLPLPAPHPLPHVPATLRATTPAPAPVVLARPGTHARAGTHGGAGRRGAGLAVVVGIHVLLGWALASGLAQHVVDIVRKPIEMSIVDETPPPPPPPPPKVEKIRDQPKVATPPPAYVPPPEVVLPPAPPAPTITATQAEPPKEPTVVAPPAPAAPPAEKPAVVKQEISLACPGYQAVLSQVLEDAFDRVGITGTVRSRLTVRGNQVVDAVPVSGPKEYYKYVQGAIKRMHCSAGGSEDVQVTLDVLFGK